MTTFERRIRRRGAIDRAVRLIRLAMSEENPATAALALEASWEPLSEALAAAEGAEERAEVVGAVECALRGGKEEGASARLRLLIRLYDVVADGGGEAFALRLALAEVLRLQGDVDGSAVVAREALLCAGADPMRRSEALILLVEALLGRSDVREAARWHRVRGPEPEDLRWLLQGARIVARLGDGSAAEVFLSKANKVAAKTPRGEGECPWVRFYRTKAEVFTVLGKLSEAAEACEMSLKVLMETESSPPKPVDLERRIEISAILADLLARIGDPREGTLRQEIDALRARLAAQRGRHLRPV